MSPVTRHRKQRPHPDRHQDAHHQQRRHAVVHHLRGPQDHGPGNDREHKLRHVIQALRRRHERDGQADQDGDGQPPPLNRVLGGGGGRSRQRL